MLFMVLVLGTGIPGYIILVFCAGLTCCTVSRVNITPYHHPILVLPSIRQANLDAPHRIGEFLWGMLYCRHPSWVQVLFSTSPWKKCGQSPVLQVFSVYKLPMCAWLNKRLKKLLSELIAKRACSNIFHVRRQVKTVEDGTAGLSRCVHPGLRGHLVLCTCSWSRAFTKGDPGQKNERDSWYLTRGKFLCLTLTFWNLALRGIPPSPWNFLILLTLLGVTMATIIYRYDARFNGSTCWTLRSDHPCRGVQGSMMQPSQRMLKGRKKTAWLPNGADIADGWIHMERSCLGGWWREPTHWSCEG